ncbi:hypothetical protein GT020_12200 [Glutamicibacter soli]|uniref:Capsule synthesis protein CapA domain-containing protein n=1 Tax=Glutamicibacter soli TaxID=453836 RepID=A0A6L9G894_9MICC|nr:hypothetical protein [Glutamicibacter soli]
MQEINHVLSGTIDEVVERISTLEPFFAKQESEPQTTEGGNDFTYDAATGTFRRPEDTARGEAILIAGGSLLYDRMLERTAQAAGAYNFEQFFSGLRKSIASGDLAIASLNATVADMYPRTSEMSATISGRGHYSNARREYLEGIHYAGFRALALSNGYNLDAGARGALTTRQNVATHGIVPFGLGRYKAPIFEVNGIRIALLSYSLEVNLSETLTAEGRDALLNIFDAQRAAADVANAKQRGAQFILCYLDGRAPGNKFSRKDREEAAGVLAEAGASYVVCTQPTAITRYSRHTTADGRVVPVASGMGALMAGIDRPYTKISLLLRITLRQLPDGSLDVSDSYIPTQRQPWERGGILPVAAAHRYFGTSELDEETIGKVESTLRRLLGRDITADNTRHMTHRTPGSPQFSPAEISRILGVKFSESDIALLGEAYHRPMEIVGTKDSFRSGTCAVIMQHSRGNPKWRTNFPAIQPTQFEADKPSLVIANKEISGLPSLVVTDPWEAFIKLVYSVRDKYTPFTIAVTGTAGKTTTKEMLSAVLPRYGQTLCLTGNWNTEMTAASTIMKLTPNDKFFIQEVHGATPGSASANSRMVRPDIAVITSIADGHLEQMGTVENILENKLGIADGLRKDGLLILNDDNEYLHHAEPHANTKRFGIENENADYKARNVIAEGQHQSFEIVEPNGSVHAAELSIPGLHNVSNALAAFAAARESGVPSHVIIAGLSRYRSSATRQNIMDVGGYRIFLDAYNSNVLSLSNALDTLQLLEPAAEGGRRIVVMGDMGEQGAKLVENHQLIGHKIADMDFDMFFGIGEGTAHTARIVRESQISTWHFMEFENLIAELSRQIRPSDVLLFKAAGAMNLTKNVVFPLFGKIV